MKVGKANLHGHPRFDPYHLFISSIPYMVDSARSSAKIDAHSYRGFLVGAAVFALSPQDQETAIFTTGNLKRAQHRAKVCAEKKVLAQAQRAGYTEALGLVVAGTSDIELIEEVTGVPTPTLHPCLECRALFDEHPLMKDETLIVTVGIDADDYQVHNNGDMQAFYTDKKTELLQQPSGSSFDNWEQRIAAYMFLTSGEASLPEQERRSQSKLAQMALLAVAIEG